MYNKIKEGKQYYFGVGYHSAIATKEKNVLCYLELQSPNKYENTWHLLNDKVLETRFNCKRNHGQEGKTTAMLIDIETLGKNKEFIELMQYVNNQ